MSSAEVLILVYEQAIIAAILVTMILAMAIKKRLVACLLLIAVALHFVFFTVLGGGLYWYQTLKYEFIGALIVATISLIYAKRFVTLGLFLLPTFAFMLGKLVLQHGDADSFDSNINADIVLAYATAPVFAALAVVYFSGAFLEKRHRRV